MDLTTATMLESDIIPISVIQSENLRENLTPDQLKDGYLSIAFSENEFRAFNRDLGVVVAKEKGQVVGYCCVSSAAFNAQFPILGQIVGNLSTYLVPGTEKRPTEATTCFYGPACIAMPFRGRNVLTHLFSHGLKLSKHAGYSFCFSFISSENQRSLKAHLKLPFHKVGNVAYNANEYIVIACELIGVKSLIGLPLKEI
jgi:L-amino acid N-acyltransferase YncA